MARTPIAAAVAISWVWLWTAPAAGGTVTVEGQAPGPTPFLAVLELAVDDPGALRSVEVVIEPKPGSAARPIGARYTRSYLEARGYLDPQTGSLALPVFGLYAGFDNSVALKATFRGSRASRVTVEVPTPAWDDPSGVYANPTVVQPRAPADRLSYDYVLLKGYVEGLSPVIVDTDGEVRWVGTAGASSQPAILFENGIYVGDGTRLVRMELDGTSRDLADYADLGVVQFHHNFDPGKRGILVQVDTADAIESVILEVDASGDVLETWDMNEIVGSAMQAGGDDPSGFVKEGVDWFHSNAVAYDPSDDTLLVSSRESFVIAIDYDTGTIRWILGDPAKSWYQYPSLRRFALELGSDTLPPIGQHALSVAGRELLLFDNGSNSQNHTPAGESRDYSAARRYRIDPRRGRATETWTYVAEPPIYSPFCSSIYRDRRKDYLLDYSLAGPFLSTDVVGLTRRGAVAFHYSYPILDGCSIAWNAIPIHLEKLVFRDPPPTPAASAARAPRTARPGR